jgi:hypothetical protein
MQHRTPYDLMCIEMHSTIRIKYNIIFNKTNLKEKQNSTTAKAVKASQT